MAEENAVAERRKAIGARLKAMREHAFLTQEDLGVKIGVSGAAVANWESGANGIKSRLMPSLLEALGTDANTLLGDSPEKPVMVTASEIADKILSDPMVKAFIALPYEERKRLIEIATILKKED